MELIVFVILVCVLKPVLKIFNCITLKIYMPVCECVSDSNQQHLTYGCQI